MLSNHFGDFGVGRVLASEKYGVIKAAKVLSVVFVQNKDQYIVQIGYISENKFEPGQSRDSLSIYTWDRLNELFPKQWKADELKAKSGDILEGQDPDTQERVLLYYISDSRVFRMTEWKGSPNSSASLGYYSRMLKDLKVLKSSGGNAYSTELGRF